MEGARAAACPAAEMPTPEESTSIAAGGTAVPTVASEGAAASSWVVDLESALRGPGSSTSAAGERRRRASIYRVPPRIRDRSLLAYTPGVVSFGPNHHGVDCLMPMEEHKRTALSHFLRRANRPLEELAAAVDEVAADLMDSYEGLDEKWRDREAFLKLMVLDGCFMLEVFLCAAASQSSSAGYDQNDPVFGSKGRAYVFPQIRRDMLLIENQLPLLLLHSLAHLAYGVVEGPVATLPEHHGSVHELVLGFFPDKRPVLRYSECAIPRDGAPRRLASCVLNLCSIDVHRRLLEFDARPASCLNGAPLGLHVLDVYRSSMLLDGHWPGGSTSSASFLKMHGVTFRPLSTGSFKDVRFDAGDGCLHLPVVLVGDVAVDIFLNLLAFEKLHPAAGNEVNNYLVLMGSLVRSVGDVGVLDAAGIITHRLAMTNEAVLTVFEKICKEAFVHGVVGGDRDQDTRTMELELLAYCHRMRARLCSLLHFCKPTPVVTALLAVPAFCISIYAAFIKKRS